MRIVTALLLSAVACFGAGWTQLFNGKDLDGWEMTGPGRFVVEDGMMKTEGGMGLLYYKPSRFRQHDSPRGFQDCPPPMPIPV